MYSDRISVDPNVQHGRPTIKGTRVPVHVLIGSVAGGMTIKQTAHEYGVEPDNVKAALEYASRLVSDEEFQPTHA